MVRGTRLKSRAQSNLRRRGEYRRAGEHGHRRRAPPIFESAVVLREAAQERAGCCAVADLAK